ncbi:MAG: DUF6942 family protein [Marinomonas sp.]|uniref:Uncharacterized protein n=1 Tax=Marinomonas pontica TaxID=264739 RepID=A0ABN6WPV0_9GAMM|nr:hypothetical protein MACH16_15360 [Marinomonas pontica]
MSDLWLGASIQQARCIFLMPNKPIFPSSESEPVSVARLIELNGNHWRKIFTIMAKLVATDLLSWKSVRDDCLLDWVGIAFSVDQIHDCEQTVFIVGKTFEADLPIKKQAVKVGHKQIAYVSYPYVWCPYLDYRQFPNSLISELRACILESKC